MFWPKEIWRRYGNSLADFKSPANAKQAVQCLNHMVTPQVMLHLASPYNAKDNCADCDTNGLLKDKTESNSKH